MLLSFGDLGGIRPQRIPVGNSRRRDVVLQHGDLAGPGRTDTPRQAPRPRIRRPCDLGQSRAGILLPAGLRGPACRRASRREPFDRSGSRVGPAPPSPDPERPTTEPTARAHSRRILTSTATLNTPNNQLNHKEAIVATVSWVCPTRKARMARTRWEDGARTRVPAAGGLPARHARSDEGGFWEICRSFLLGVQPRGLQFENVREGRSPR